MFSFCQKTADETPLASVTSKFELTRSKFDSGGQIFDSGVHVIFTNRKLSKDKIFLKKCPKFTSRLNSSADNHQILENLSSQLAARVLYKPNLHFWQNRQFDRNFSALHESLILIQTCKRALNLEPNTKNSV
jgi:hypothetical protein